MGEPWFDPGRPPADATVATFLAGLRSRVAALEAVGVSAVETMCLLDTDGRGVIVTVDWDVPSLPEEQSLQLALRIPEQDDCEVTGCLGDHYLMDSYAADDPDCLTLRDPDPDRCAAAAVEWLTDHLTRPVVRDEWWHAGMVVRQRWHFDGSDVPVVRDRWTGWRGWWGYLADRGAPDRTVVVRDVSRP
ncbi:hypothetical protein V6U81_11170 [Micromonospora sp. CPCC 205711]|uniref:hypothetical protein n=1 Tax=Micromonospora sp. CPCC 205547 TaxID=3122400 RepID=UPI002FF14685